MLLLLPSFQPQWNKALKNCSDRWWKKYADLYLSLVVADERTEDCLLLLAVTSSSCPFDIHGCVGESNDGNGDFQRKIPGVEVNVVRIQIDILFPLLFFSPLCAFGTKSASECGKRYSSEEMLPTAQDLKFSFLLLFRTGKPNLLSFSFPHLNNFLMLWDGLMLIASFPASSSRCLRLGGVFRSVCDVFND